MAVSYFPNLVFLKNGILKNFCHIISMNMLLSASFWHSFGQASALFFSPHGLLPINVNVWYLLSAEMYFIACEASFHWFIQRSERG